MLLAMTERVVAQGFIPCTPQVGDQPRPYDVYVIQQVQIASALSCLAMTKVGMLLAMTKGRHAPHNDKEGRSAGVHPPHASCRGPAPTLRCLRYTARPDCFGTVVPRNDKGRHAPRNDKGKNAPRNDKGGRSAGVHPPHASCRGPAPTLRRNDKEEEIQRINLNEVN